MVKELLQTTFQESYNMSRKQLPTRPTVAIIFYFMLFHRSSQLFKGAEFLRVQHSRLFANLRHRANRHRHHNIFYVSRTDVLKK